MRDLEYPGAHAVGNTAPQAAATLSRSGHKSILPLPYWGMSDDGGGGHRVLKPNLILTMQKGARGPW